MIETPVSASPAMIARSIGAAPRQRGSSDGCTLKISYSLSSGSRHQHAVRAEHERVGLGGGDPLEHLGRVQRLGLDQLEAERARGVGDRRRLQRAAAAARAVGPRDRPAPAGAALAASRSSTAAANGEVPR